MRKQIGWLMSVVCAVSLMGCGNSDLASVSGTVTLDDKPLANASVVFVPAVGGRPAGAKTDAEGKYVLNFSDSEQGAIPGQNRVQIRTKADPYTDENGKPVPGKPEIVPMEYNTRSKLEFTVEPNKQNIADFQLKSGGKVETSQSGY